MATHSSKHVRVNSDQSLVVNTIYEHRGRSFETPAAQCHEHSQFCSALSLVSN